MSTNFTEPLWELVIGAVLVIVLSFIIGVLVLDIAWWILHEIL